MTSALLCLNMTNDFIHPDGKLSGNGYVDFAQQHGTVERITRLQNHFRDQAHLVIHGRLSYSKNYYEHPVNSPLLGVVRERQALQQGTWGAEFFEPTAPKEEEAVINMYRISAFHRTRLEIILRTQGIDHLYIAGMPTNIAVETTAREAHDHDFTVHMVEDACIARNDELHNLSVQALSDFAMIKKTGDVLVQLAMEN